MQVNLSSAVQHEVDDTEIFSVFQQFHAFVGRFVE